MSIAKINQRFTKNPIDQKMLDAKIINEEYKIWRKVVPLLYETIQVYKLPESPSNIFKWIPNGIHNSNSNSSNVSAKFLISSHATYNNNKNTKISIGTIDLPATLSNNYISEEPIPIPDQQGAATSKFQIIESFEHEDEVKLVEINENNPEMFASFQISGDIAIYDMKKSSGGISSSTLKLKNHSSLGKSLNWRPHQANQLLSGSCDSIILWDLNKQSHGDTVEPQHVYYDNDTTSLSWNKVLPHVFGAATNPRDLKIFDVRTNGDAVYHVTNTHRATINSIEFHPSSSSMFATGSDDCTISLWDMRYVTRPFRQLFGNVSGVTKLKFDSDQNNILVNLDRSRRLYFWDLNEIRAGDFDEEIYTNGLQKDPDLEDPCLRFIHGGHVGNINDFDVSRDMFNVYGSVGDDQLIEFWKPFFVKNDEEEDEDEEQLLEKQAEEEIRLKRKEEEHQIEQAAEETEVTTTMGEDKMNIDEKESKKSDNADEEQTVVSAATEATTSIITATTIETSKNDLKDTRINENEDKPDVSMSTNADN